MCVLVVLVASLALAAGLPQNPSLSEQDAALALPAVYDDFQCTEDGTFMDPYQCDVYWRCKDLVPTQHLCDDGLVFDTLKGHAGHADPCDTPFLIDCTGREFLQDPTNPQPECPRRHGIFEDPDPTNCKTFHICKEGLVERTSDCTTGLHFNPITGICEWPKTVKRQGCIELQNNCIPNGNFCCTGESVFSIHGVSIPSPTYLDPEDCQKFYVCLSKITPQHASCNSGQVYNDKTMLCDFPENVPDCVGWYRDDPQFAHYYYYEDEAPAAQDVGAQDTPV